MYRTQQQKIQQKAKQLLRESKITAAPVDVEAIAGILNIEVRKTPAEDDLSGFLLRPINGVPVIGVNARHHYNRQRFTIGHEIGHFVLHQSAEVHVDKFVLMLRDEKSSKGENIEEIEANRFAAELLIPYDFIAEDLPKYSSNGLLDDRALARLAGHYQVSVQAMTNRLISIGFIYDGALP